MYEVNQPHLTSALLELKILKAIGETGNQWGPCAAKNNVRFILLRVALRRVLSGGVVSF